MKPFINDIIVRSQRKSERWINTEGRKYRNQRFVPNSIESKRYPVMLKGGEPKIINQGKKIASRMYLTKARVVIG